MHVNTGSVEWLLCPDSQCQLTLFPWGNEKLSLIMNSYMRNMKDYYYKRLLNKCKILSGVQGELKSFQSFFIELFIFFP